MLSLCRLPVFQAAELVTEKCEAYEAHMRDVRDYLEERLEVRAAVSPGPGQRDFTSPSAGERWGCGLVAGGLITLGERSCEGCSPVPGDPGDNQGHERRGKN